MARPLAFRRETATLLVARQDGADFGLGQGLMDFHTGTAGIGEDDLNAFALERFDEQVAAEHCGADFGARLRFRGGFLFRAFSDPCSWFSFCCG